MPSVFITGGAAGIGQQLAKLYLADGWQVAVASIENSAELAKPPAQSLTEQDNYHYQQLDVTDAEALATAIENFATKTGSLDLLIANAGINHPKASVPDFDIGRRVIEINVLGVLNSFAPAIKIMQKQGHGQLAAMGSIAGTIGTPGTAIYGASKAAVLNLCEAFGIDLAEHGISVTAIAPGFIATELTQANKHKMPFLLSSAEAAVQIKTAITKRRSFVMFPWPLMLMARLMYHLPRSWYRWFMRKDPLGMRQ